ncbi:transcription elongation factor GreB [Nisaea acidiphila]|uniref:Transcription elongation factor GreB n=1 Tax=Nisaea acidiphila TaxID=1862145 RepID=A0A9J7AS48_9PROT|nr:transcription elongation factor GreB [Nisaea acidiphila]UUX48141.1 transcription elongation factor GreB [Nisaea acidiphila]
MSKAFVKESDADFEEEDEVPDPSPKGVKNYITPRGFKALQDELRQLRRVERPKIVEIVSWAAGNGDRSENGDYIYGKKRLREIDRRMRFLLKRMEAAEIVDPLQQPNKHKIFFGATVTYADEEDNERTVRIVGVDEADLERGEVSWVSPIARALLKAEVGDLVEVRTPRGPQEIEVVAIVYEER